MAEVAAAVPEEVTAEAPEEETPEVPQEAPKEIVKVKTWKSADKPKRHERKAPPPPPLDPTKPTPKVFQRFDGGETPGFLRIWVDEEPEKIDLAAIVEESELSIEQLKG